MKKLFLLLILVPIFSICQTNIKDKQAVYGTWQKSESPYIIEGEAFVPEGKILVIKPGVIIQFKTGENRDYRYEDGELNKEINVGFLRVKGKIIAKGKKNKPIKFIAYGEGNWGNVFMENSKDNVFKYCEFSGSYYVRTVTKTDNATGALTFINSSGDVSYCIFANNGWTALNCKQGSSPILQNLTVVGNKYGIECNSNSKPTIKNTILWNNETQFYFNGGSNPSIYNSSLQDYKLPKELIDLGKNILGANPRFKNEEINDYTLTKKSPCKGLNMGARP